MDNAPACGQRCIQEMWLWGGGGEQNIPILLEASNVSLLSPCGFIEGLVPSLHYKFAVDGLASTSVKMANVLATKCVKSWLGLTCSTSVAVLHHPAVLDVPFLSHYRTKDKLVSCLLPLSP